MYEVIAVGAHSGVTLSFLPRALVNHVVPCVKLSISGWGWGYPLCAAIILASKSGFKCQGLITVYSAESAFLQTQLLCLLWWFCSENTCFQLWKVICWHDSLMPQHYGFRESKLNEEDAWLYSFCTFWLGCEPVKLKISSLNSMRFDGGVSIPAEWSTIPCTKYDLPENLKFSKIKNKCFCLLMSF